MKKIQLVNALHIPDETCELAEGESVQSALNQPGAIVDVSDEFADRAIYDGDAVLYVEPATAGEAETVAAEGAATDSAAPNTADE